MNEPPTSDAWYREGLRFSCTRCGHCCGGAPGHVWVSDQEGERLAHHLGLSLAAFRERYTEPVAGRGRSLREGGAEEDYRCVFFEPGSGCGVYALRPTQCRTWPFWRSVVKSPASWREHGRGCPGMDSGTAHTADIIASTARRDGVPD